MTSVNNSLIRFGLAAFLGLGLSVPVGLAQTAPAPDNDKITNRQADSFGDYLDKHPEQREDLNKNPRLIDNKEYMGSHPELREYLSNHPEARENFKRHPKQFMSKVRKNERNERDERREERREHRHKKS